MKHSNEQKPHSKILGNLKLSCLGHISKTVINVVSQWGKKKSVEI